MSGSSSTISRLGFWSSAMFGGLDAFQERVLQRGLAVALAQYLRGAGKGEASPVEDEHMVADFLDVRKGMLGEQHGPALGMEPREDGLDARPRRGVQPAHGLVQHIQVASGEETRGQAELLRHALGVGAHRLVYPDRFQ